MREFPLLLGVLICSLPLQASALKIDDRRGLNGSFEAGKAGRPPAGWQVVRGAGVVDRKLAHDGKASLRLESPDLSDLRAESAGIQLAIGKRYEVRGWVRTEQLEVRDLDRSPVAIGAALSMASLPFDYHSESVGGTRDWTLLRLRFVATRAEDRIVCLAGPGGRVRGKVWFDDIRIEEAPPAGEWPAAPAVETFGPGYRYPKGGWIYLHIEGQPYERGYQHGFLLAPEIGRYLDRCALKLDPKSREHAWQTARTMANALFLRGYEKEILEEMRGIADGAAARGIRFSGRPLDLVDVVTINSLTEIDFIQAALPVTPTGLEGLHLVPPGYFDPKRDVPPTERCSAFAATGPATRDGTLVIGHITMWPLTLSEQTNIMLDLKPAAGHRILMQSYPGGIQSGMDYYQNDAGIVLTETTIRQSPFNINGTPEAFRARKAVQYGASIEDVIEALGTFNNGLLTNEWLVGDAKTNQIAMYELGTYKRKLYRSSQNEWFGGAEGFYWGCNNAKDLNVRLEYAPDPNGTPAHLPFVPSERDIKWQELYEEYKGRIDEQFAFLAFRTAPLVMSSAFDAKLTTAVMAQHLMCWASFGKPNQRERVPSEWERRNYPHIAGIYPAGYSLFQAEPSPSLAAAIQEREAARLRARPQPSAAAGQPKARYKDRLWKGWILPAADGDVWLSAGSAAYHAVLSDPEWEKALEAHRTLYLESALQNDQPVLRIASQTRSRQWFQIAANKGVLLLDALRRQLGDDRFFELMTAFFSAHTTKTVGSAAFLDAVEKSGGAPVRSSFAGWLESAGPFDNGPGARSAGAAYLTASLLGRLNSAVLVYGTTREAGANRYAAEVFQRRCLDWYEREVPILKDFELTEDDLRFRDLIYIGRPETNRALADVAGKIGLAYEGALFRMNEEAHASADEALIVAAANPLDRSRMILVVAGNSPLETVRAASASLERCEYAIYNLGKRVTCGFQAR